MTETTLFKPLKIGTMQLNHRIGMAPMTRLRATRDRIPTPLMKEYYSQRASVPGTLLLTEGAFISPASCGGFPNGPGIWSEEQVAAWKTITDEVHAKGCFIFCQIFAMGRAADVNTAAEDGVEIVAPSAVPIDADTATPRPMSIEEIKQTVRDFATAADNAIRAGFDGVECHGANGYLTDQFIQDTANKRNDEYGGSVENRARFMVEVMEAVVKAIGPERVGLRLSPWSRFQGMGMEEPIPQFSYIIEEARRLDLAYLHLIESRVFGASDFESGEGLDFAYDLWDGPLLVAGGYGPVNARKLVDEEYPEKDIVVIIGRPFVSSPDLVYRIKQGLELATYDRGTFYNGQSPVGYVDYPFSPEYLASEKDARVF
ncbi:hypothetical protein BJX99DRAFT_268675 [Aspergillus californicus]